MRFLNQQQYFMDIQNRYLPTSLPVKINKSGKDTLGLCCGCVFCEGVIKLRGGGTATIINVISLVSDILTRTNYKLDIF